VLQGLRKMPASSLAHLQAPQSHQIIW
jgi:hypothetical protein